MPFPSEDLPIMHCCTLVPPNIVRLAIFSFLGLPRVFPWVRYPFPSLFVPGLTFFDPPAPLSPLCIQLLAPSQDFSPCPQTWPCPRRWKNFALMCISSLAPHEHPVGRPYTVLLVQQRTLRLGDTASLVSPAKSDSGRCPKGAPPIQRQGFYPALFYLHSSQADDHCPAVGKQSQRAEGTHPGSPGLLTYWPCPPRAPRYCKVKQQDTWFPGTRHRLHQDFSPKSGEAN